MKQRMAALEALTRRGTEKSFVALGEIGDARAERFRWDALDEKIGDAFDAARHSREQREHDDARSGLASRSPWLFIVFVFAALWLSGLPPFGNFFSKYLLGVAAEGATIVARSAAACRSLSCSRWHDLCHATLKSHPLTG